MKAQISGTIVMYIMTGVVIMMVIGFGVQQLFRLTNDVSAINCVHFRQEFKERLIKDRPLGYTDNEGVEVSCDTSRICFLDVDSTSNGYYSSCGTTYDPNDATSDLSPVLCDSWDDGIKKNVFLMQQDNPSFPMDSFYVKGLAPESNNGNPFLCLDVDNGMIFPLIKGKARTVQIKAQS